MITAVDTNILLDLLIPDATYGDVAERALAEAAQEGAVVLCEVVYAELAAHFPSRGELDAFVLETRLRLEPSGQDALYRAGQAWAAYARRRASTPTCPRCGASTNPLCFNCGHPVLVRRHVLADFLIGAHAEVHADRLVTRDRGYFATYFPELRLN